MANAIPVFLLPLPWMSDVKFEILMASAKCWMFLPTLNTVPPLDIAFHSGGIFRGYLDHLSSIISVSSTELWGVHSCLPRRPATCEMSCPFCAVLSGPFPSCRLIDSLMKKRIKEDNLQKSQLVLHNRQLSQVGSRLHLPKSRFKKTHGRPNQTRFIHQPPEWGSFSWKQ